MIDQVSMESFGKFAEQYEPFEWETNKGHHASDVKNKHSVLISFIRYWHVVQYLQTAFKNEKFTSVIDVGSYPGSFVKILKHFFKQKIEYFGIGLGFTDEYKKAMSGLNAELLDTEVDPSFVEPKESKEWHYSNVDCCLFLDVIEHLVNPVDCMDNINKSLRMGGKLIITTDNITSFGIVYQMLRRGASPNIPAAQSHFFYRGDWRPHFKEFSKAELEFFLQFCGFKLVKHEYFERRQGDYFLDHKGHIQSRNRYRGIKGFIRLLIIQLMPHLRDHQILIAEKVVDLNEVLMQRPKATHDINEWFKIREVYADR